MGEYIRLDGVDGYLKIGTCESLYYCRFTDLREWVRDGRAHRLDGNLEPAEYLDGAFRFRFPFPDEDGDEGARLEAYHPDYYRGVGFAVPVDFLSADIEHMSIYHWLRPRGLAFGGTNYAIPCPQGKDWPRDRLDLAFVEVVQQRPLEGQLWTVLRCGFCESLWRIDEEAARRLAAHITETQPGQAEIARRIVAGYVKGVLDG